MKKLLLITIISPLLFSSCEDGLSQGCTDLLAINYESWADNDDGSCLYQCTDIYATNHLTTTTYPVCEYQGDVVFYLDVLAAQEFTNMNIPFLDVYVGNELAGSMPTIGFTSAVTCTDTDPEPFINGKTKEELPCLGP